MNRTVAHTIVPANIGPHALRSQVSVLDVATTPFTTFRESA